MYFRNFSEIAPSSDEKIAAQVKNALIASCGCVRTACSAGIAVVAL
jgi:hypothetical protein